VLEFQAVAQKMAIGDAFLRTLCIIFVLKRPESFNPKSNKRAQNSGAV